MSGEGAEKVEMESVPLKSDTDAPATEPSPPSAPEPPKVVAPKKTWFFNAAKNKAAALEKDSEAAETEKPKKRRFWECKPATNGEQKTITIGIDTHERDEKGINDHVKLNFEDIFAEPESFHSHDCTWRSLNRVFEGTRKFFFNLFALIFFFPAAVVYGILYAFVIAFNVYIVVPGGRLLSIPFKWLAITWSFFVSSLLDPLTKSAGHMFANVQIRQYGINNAPTDLISP